MKSNPPTHRKNARLVVVDDDASVCKLIARIAEPLRTDVETIVAIDASVDMRPLCEADLVLLDLGMPGLDGIEVLRRMAAQGSRARIILISGAAPGVLESASMLGEQLALDMGEPIGKPFDLEQLRRLIRSVSPREDCAGAPDEGHLQAAIEAGNITPAYQPKVDLATGEVVGAECLARWNSTQFGVVSPEIFIPLAEKAQLMDALTRSIFRRAFEDLGRISAQHPGFQLSLNLSPSQLTDLRYPDLMHVWAMQAGIDPDQVTIEVTESEAMRDPTRYMDILIRFRLKGFHLSVDDFGTGFSSLEHLYQLPFEELKIDKTFVTGLGEHESAAVIVKTIIGLAHGLGMTSIAEGIEDQETLERLLDYGCQLGQGYVFSGALSLSDLLEYLGPDGPAPALPAEEGEVEPEVSVLSPNTSSTPSRQAS